MVNWTQSQTQPVMSSVISQLFRINFSCFSCGSDDKESAYNAEDPDSIPGSGRSSGEDNCYPCQSSCLEQSMDRGSWQATIHWTAKCWTWLGDWHFHFSAVTGSLPPSILQFSLILPLGVPELVGRTISFLGPLENQKWRINSLSLHFNWVLLFLAQIVA